MREWIICKHCSLKYRATEPVCPRCENAPVEGQLRWGDHRASGAPPPRSKLALAAPVALLLAGGAGALVYFAPPGLFNPSLPQKIARACEDKAGSDCECVGKKTEGLMTAEERAARFEPESAATRELMNTASQLCLKARLVAQCQKAKQGTEFECICIVDASVNAFTSAELDQLFAGGDRPARYTSIRNGCYR